MILPKPEDAVHKAWLYRLLIRLADDNKLMAVLHFKGGTCASMLGYLDKFSVDLYFDAQNLTDSEITVVRSQLAQHLKDLGLSIKQQSKVGIQYICKYEALGRMRSTIKLEINFPAPQANEYAPVYFSEIDRTLSAQTKETMFSNKMVAILDRWERHGSIAGRDLYDVHHFFMRGYGYLESVIVERRATSAADFFEELIQFIQTHISQTILQQDLNSLLPYAQFKRLAPTLKQETLVFLQDELSRLKLVRG